MAICRQAECIDDVGAEQIGVAESECLGQTRHSRFADALQQVLVDVVGRRSIDTVDQISAEHRVLGAPLIVDPADCHVIVFKLRDAV